jgi:hypothetical protein
MSVNMMHRNTQILSVLFLASKFWQVRRLTELSGKIIAKENQELSLPYCCVTDLCKEGTTICHLILFQIHYEVGKKNQELDSYMYWMALRFAKEDDISPFRPLNDRFLHNFQWVSF